MEKKKIAFTETYDKVAKGRAENKITQLLIESIVDPPFQDRSKMDAQKLLDLANNIRENGMINPIMVRKLSGSKYERITGARRIGAFKELGIDKIDSIIVDADDKTAIMLSISENLQRENLNAFDETLSILHLLSVHLDMTEDDVKSFLYKVNNHDLKNIKILSLDDHDLKQQITEILERVAKYSYKTFITRMRLLNLSPMLIDAIRNKNLEYSFALEINRVKDEKTIKELMDNVLLDNLSLHDLRAKVRTLLGIDNQVHNLLSPINKKIKNFAKLTHDKQNIIKQKLQEIQELLAG
jgi:ParB family chromosome partitioning protein